MYPRVHINYSSPMMNTCSKKAIHAIAHDDITSHGAETDDTLHFFALPNTLDGEEIVQLLQNDTHTYQLTQCGNGMVNYWKEEKRRTRKRQWREIRKRMEMLVKLKRELQQAHKLSTDKQGNYIAMLVAAGGRMEKHGSKEGRAVNSSRYNSKGTTHSKFLIPFQSITVHMLRSK